ncbi:hypothetical protein [Bacillus sp. FJAT-50079]|uniref:hypothetical protein n=1 Tax=Bacillus sp. FJAT-50079 TaxID=2833577 RepID=UPI001BC9F9F5|nr:hypothetical protein [Bacillus sp. FJAT-50079]MBS4209857.1 hypothetical protein [Bacillus sp. FJAT-50079]
MNIKNYYSRMTRLYIHQLILFSLVFIMIILPSMKMMYFIPANVAGFFVFLCLVYFFIKYIYFAHKWQEVTMTLSYMNVPDDKQVTYILLDSTSSHTLFDVYSFDGICHFSIVKVKGKDKRLREKGSRAGRPRVIYRLDKMGISTGVYIHIYADHGMIYLREKELPFIMTMKKQRQKELILGTSTFLIKKKYADFIFTKDERPMMTIKKGMMPVRMQLIFQPNTPVVRFAKHLSEDEKYICFCLLSLC